MGHYTDRGISIFALLIVGIVIGVILYLDMTHEKVLVHWIMKYLSILLSAIWHYIKELWHWLFS